MRYDAIICSCNKEFLQLFETEVENGKRRKRRKIVSHNFDQSIFFFDLYNSKISKFVENFNLSNLFIKFN